jgi:hydrogenase nickel incorporation protein HypA/HybF
MIHRGIEGVMHEMSLIHDLLHKIEAVAREHKASKVTRAHVRLGALSHISADHFREHFFQGTAGTIAEGAVLDIEISTNISDPRAQDILLLSINVGDCP